jgi:hypothetical protein
MPSASRISRNQPAFGISCGFIRGKARAAFASSARLTRGPRRGEGGFEGFLGLNLALLSDAYTHHISTQRLEINRGGISRSAPGALTPRNRLHRRFATSANATVMVHFHDATRPSLAAAQEHLLRHHRPVNNRERRPVARMFRSNFRRSRD